MVGEHEAGYAVGRLHVGRFASERYLDGCRAPGDEGCEAALADAEERFVDLGSC
jgi:hypothetical protein